MANKKGKTPLKFLIWLLVIIAAIILFLSTVNLLMPILVNRGKEVTVPDLIGMNKDDAIMTINRLGLKTGEIRSVFNQEIPPGRVAAQNPRPGRRVKIGREVDLDISSGAATVQIPNLEGLPLTSAITTLERLGFTVVRVESIRATAFPAGRVVATSPPFGSDARRGSEIVITVSTKSGTFPMPNLVGLNIETARGIIANHGLSIAQLKPAISSEPVGTVLFQYPEEGMLVAPGDTVSLIVATQNGTIK